MSGLGYLYSLHRLASDNDLMRLQNLSFHLGQGCEGQSEDSQAKERVMIIIAFTFNAKKIFIRYLYCYIAWVRTTIEYATPNLSFHLVQFENAKG